MSNRKLSFGLWYDFRNPQQWKQNDTELYEKCIAQIARAENMGFEDVWLSEHHFFEDNYSSTNSVTIYDARFLGRKVENIYLASHDYSAPPMRKGESDAKYIHQMAAFMQLFPLRVRQKCNPALTDKGRDCRSQ